MAALPEGLGRPRVRADSGFFDRKVAAAALANGADFAIAAKRNKAVRRSAAKLGQDAWTPAVGMAGAEVATCDYRPAEWTDGTRTIVRRVLVEPDEVRRGPRSRRRRTIDPTQLALVLGGGRRPRLGLQLHRHQPRRRRHRIESWVRGRPRSRSACATPSGLALRHLPSGYSTVNAVWMWSALLALNLSVFCQSLGGVDTDGRAHAKRDRRELFNLPARVLHHARHLVLRLNRVHHHGGLPARVADLVRSAPRRPLSDPALTRPPPHAPAATDRV